MFEGHSFLINEKLPCPLPMKELERSVGQPHDARSGLPGSLMIRITGPGALEGADGRLG